MMRLVFNDKYENKIIKNNSFLNVQDVQKHSVSQIIFLAKLTVKKQQKV